RQFGTGGIIKKVLPYLEPEFFIIYGDSYLNINYAAIMQYFSKTKKLGLMLIHRNYNLEAKGNVILENKLIKSYNPRNWEQDMLYSYSNACILSKHICELFFGQQFISLEEIFSILIEKNELLGYEISQENKEITASDGIDKLIKYLKVLEI
ncbi:MAG: hypothetical protein HY934_02785, partial [Candidatus Firestonebacteria bacterium]|nr:hypothetical protein [Candidatus Firestonebacteria bacterium]